MCNTLFVSALSSTAVTHPQICLLDKTEILAYDLFHQLPYYTTGPSRPLQQRCEQWECTADLTTASTANILRIPYTLAQRKPRERGQRQRERSCRIRERYDNVVLRIKSGVVNQMYGGCNLEQF